MSSLTKSRGASPSTNIENNLAVISQVVERVEPDFNQLAKIHGAVNFEREFSFAMQILKENSYLLQIALGDKDSLKTAILNVAAIGLSLSPVHKLAYLVPRKKKICLDISYRGFIQLGVDVGAIRWATAEIVYETDAFELRGASEEPLHKRNPFAKERGKIIGAYCVAKTHSDDYLTTCMSLDEIYKIRGRSEAWRAYERDKTKVNPWVTDEEEMIKKTVIRRAYKSWPMTDTRMRLDQAIEVGSEAEAETKEREVLPEEENHSVGIIQELLKKLGRTEEAFIGHLMRVYKRDIKSLEDLTEIETNQAIVMLEGFLANKKAAK